jgi:hypothetical protein
MSGLIDPANGAFLITPSDSANLAQNTTGIYAGGAGEVKVDMINGDTVTFTVPAGVVLPIQIRKVYATGTTASGVVGLY